MATVQPQIPPELQQSVSRETFAALELYQERLKVWQARINLVGQSTLDDFWPRHIVDSLQLLRLAGQAHSWVDVGTGGGFPGLVIAICLTQLRPEAEVLMFEKHQKKAGFLREILRLTSSRGRVVAEPFRSDHPALPKDIDVISARAVTSLRGLLELTYPRLSGLALGLFPKGQQVDAELTEAARYWKFDAERHSSIVDPASTILTVRRAEPLNRSGAQIQKEKP